MTNNIQDLTPDFAPQIAKLRKLCFPHLGKLSSVLSDEEGIKRGMTSTHHTKSYYIGLVHSDILFGYIDYTKLIPRYAKDIHFRWSQDLTISESKFKPQIELNYICVHPKLRGTKAAQKLMDVLVKRFKRIFLQTDRGTFEAAKHIYRKYGFKNIDKTNAQQFYYKG